MNNVNAYHLIHSILFQTWLHCFQVPARVALGVTTLLAMSTTQVSQQINKDVLTKLHMYPNLTQVF